jgi:hypothetical protein
MRRVVERLLTRHVPKPVYGRWGPAYSAKQVDARIDLANEDPCGPCGSYRLDKHMEKNKENKERKSSCADVNMYNSCSGDYFAMSLQHDDTRM